MSQNKHKYADILIAVANGENIQIQHYDIRAEWDNVDYQTVLSHIYSDKGTGCIRIKPKTIMINGHEVPEPLRVKPEYSSEYYYPSIGIYTDTAYDYSHWTDGVLDNERFNCGILHSTEEAAIKHAEALLSFTKVKE